MEYNIQKNPVNGGEYCFFTHNNKEYYADRACVFDYGIIETMIFASKNEQVTSWSELYCDRSGKSLTECIEEFINTLNDAKQ